MNADTRVFIAMSGGVDSAVTAVKLIEKGYQVTGIHMQTWKDPLAQADSSDTILDVNLAEKTANALGIPFIPLDLRDVFYKRVVKDFLRQYLGGLTPNPCLFCNPQVKWGILQSYALEHGADYFATGHYARIERQDSGKVWLLRGKDRSKDQSYVLSMLSQFQLSRSLLPLGEMTKAEVRTLAQNRNLPVADRQDSQDLCFLGDGDYREFLQRYAPGSFEIGEIVDIHGNVLGTHEGLPFYTIGQRKGIRIAAAEPYYVIDKDIQNDRLIIGFAEQTGKNRLTALQPNWICGHAPEVGCEYGVMIRYRAKQVPAVLIAATDREFRLEFKHAISGITPGQVAVLYQDEVCLGGGVIQSFA